MHKKIERIKRLNVFSDCEVDIQVRKVQTKQIDELESSSSRLIDHNIDLLDELEVKEAICRYGLLNRQNAKAGGFGSKTKTRLI